MKPVRLFTTALCLALAGTAAHAQEIGQNAAASISPWRVVSSLVLCLALGAVAIFALRRRYGLNRLPLLGGEVPRRIKVIEQQALGPQRSLCLVEIDGCAYAALFAPQTATLVALASETTGESSAKAAP